MSQYSSPKASEEGRRKVFNESLRAAIDLGVSNMCSELDFATLDAIEKVANEYPNSKSESVKAARQSFQNYLDYLHEIHSATRKSG